MFEAFQFGPFILWTHVVFLMLAIWLAFEFFMRLAQSANFSLQQFQDYAKWYVLAFGLGGRLFAILATYRVYIKDPLRMFVVWDGNFSFLGGIIGIGIVLYIVNRQSRATFLQWLDVLLPAATFGLFFEWLGKFFSGQEYGKPTDLPWGITYDTIGVRYAVPIHPVQLYYGFFFLILSFLLLVVRKHAKRAGSETLVGIILASLATFFFEMFRGDFGIPVFATQLDFVLLVALFIGLGVFALIELRLSQRMVIVYELSMGLTFGAYLLARPWLPLPAYELRFTQLLSVLALLSVVVYVVVHRRRYPHL